MGAATLPPWGVLSTGNQFSELLLVPRAWPQSSSDDERTKQWLRWRDAVATDLERLLWPKYIPTAGQWSRDPDPTLIDADFELLRALHSNLGDNVRGRGSNATEHRMFFDEEDDENVGIGVEYGRYDPDLPKHLPRNLSDLITQSIGDIVGTLHLQLKEMFQRPRAYQVALLQNRQFFQYLWAKTGGTPSLISGHCVQGCLGCCGVFARFDASLSAASIETFQQFAVDIGDRRVFAGVHYPSDNLSSWYTALKLIPAVFGADAPKVKQFLWGAISTKSDVYAAMVSKGESSPYYATVVELQNLCGT